MVYPEGHRSAKNESLPLKRGMLHYAHSRGVPVQIIMSAGKEDVLNEKTGTAGFGKAMITSYSRVSSRPEAAPGRGGGGGRSTATAAGEQPAGSCWYAARPGGGGPTPTRGRSHPLAP
jgi:hypothetical protein